MLSWTCRLMWRCTWPTLALVVLLNLALPAPLLGEAVGLAADGHRSLERLNRLTSSIQHLKSNSDNNNNDMYNSRAEPPTRLPPKAMHLLSVDPTNEAGVPPSNPAPTQPSNPTPVTPVVGDIPATYSWIGHGAIELNKYTQTCFNSAWAHAALTALEAFNWLYDQTSTPVALSMEQLIDCAGVDSCDNLSWDNASGRVQAAWDWIIQQYNSSSGFSLCTQDQYPWNLGASKCAAPSSCAYTNYMKSYSVLVNADDATIQQRVMISPVVALVDAAGAWIGGSSPSDPISATFCQQDIEQAHGSWMTIIGWNTTASVPYWSLLDMESRVQAFAMGQNTCSMNNYLMQPSS